MTIEHAPSSLERNTFRGGSRLRLWRKSRTKVGLASFTGMSPSPRSIAGCLRFFTLIQCFDRPARVLVDNFEDIAADWNSLFSRRLLLTVVELKCELNGLLSGTPCGSYGNASQADCGTERIEAASWAGQKSGTVSSPLGAERNHKASLSRRRRSVAFAALSMSD